MRRPEGNPWASVGAGAEWWRGETVPHPPVTPRSQAHLVRGSGPAETTPAVGLDASVASRLAAGRDAGGDPAVAAASKEPVARPAGRRTRKAPRAPAEIPVAVPLPPDAAGPAQPEAAQPEAGDSGSPGQAGDPAAGTVDEGGPVVAEQVAELAVANLGIPGGDVAGETRASSAGPESDRPAPEVADTTGDRSAEDRFDEPTDDLMAGRPAAPTTGTGDTADRAEPEPAATSTDDDTGHESGRDCVPDVMVLPEPNRERPTVVLARGPVPGQQQPSHPTSRPATDLSAAAASPPAAKRVAATRGTRGRAPQGQSLMAAKLETSPFWFDPGVGDGPPADAPSATTSTAAPSRLGVPPRRRPPAPRKPASGLPTLLVLALVAAFFAWVSAEPLWLAVGHGEHGTATVGQCTGSGITQRCIGQFTADRGGFTVPDVALLGVDHARRAAGAALPARMADRDSRQAFVGAGDVTLHLRWALGVLLVLLCGLGIALSTGARRLETARARRRAVLISLVGPLALLAGFLVVAY